MQLYKFLYIMIIISLVLLSSCAKVIPSESVTEMTFEKVLFGLYEQDNNTDNGREEITWLILYEDESKMLIIAEKCIDVFPFDETNVEKMTWENSTIRKWLNNEFYNDTFNDEEKSRIIIEKQENNGNTKFLTQGSKATNDKIFLLSSEDAYKYFNSDKDRIALYTEYSQKKYYVTENPRCPWWLRTIGQFDFTFITVGVTGELFYNGNVMGVEHIGVRPVIWISK